MLNINVNTPIEAYQVRDKTILVKRDDLMGDGHFLPPWGKIEGISKLVENRIDKTRPLTHLSVRGSWSGWTLAAICADMDIEFIYSYPESKSFDHDILEHVKSLYPNTKFNPLKPQITKIQYYQLRNNADENGWQMLNYGFDDDLYISYLKNRIKSVSEPFNALCVASGSGVNLSGFAMGYHGDINSVTVSSVKTIEKMLKTKKIPLHSFSRHVMIYESEFEFYDTMRDFETPFPCNQFWDKKQWYWIEKNIDILPDKTLMWNLGGIYELPRTI